MTQLAKVENNKLANIPEYMRGDIASRDGKEGLTQNDMPPVPRLKLAQALSAERKRSNENYNPDLKEGEFYNSLTGEVYGDTVTVIPLHFFNEYVEFDEENKVVKFYERGEFPPIEDTVVEKGKKPKCTTFKNRMSLLLKEDGSVTPIVVGFKYVGKKKTPTTLWNFLIAEKQGPAYAYQYTLTSLTRANEKGEWFTGKFERGDFTPANLYQQAKEYFSALQDAGVKIDVSGIEVPAEDNDTSFDAVNEVA